jgi:hypothetical protein
MLPIMSSSTHETKAGLFVITTMVAISFCTGCSNHDNFLGDMGFTFSKSSLVVDENPFQLREEVRYIKATLTYSQAKTLYKQFKSQRASQAFAPPITPKSILRISNTSWNPQSVKKYWSDSFEKSHTETYQCKYIFDIQNPGNITLYFYAWCPYD